RREAWMPSGQMLEPIVYVNGEVRPELRCLDVQTTVGGGRLDSATLEFELGLTGDMYHDTSLLALWGKGPLAVNVTIPTAAGERLIHVGTIAQRHINIGEMLAERLVSRLEPHHFGVQLLGPEILTASKTTRFTIYNPGPPGSDTPLETVLQSASGPDGFIIAKDVIFNPLLDYKPTGNRSSHRNEKGRHYFLDLGQSRTNSALAYRGEPEVVDPRVVGEEFPNSDAHLGGGFWTLAQAVYYLCWTLNRDELLIANPPSLTDLELVLKDVTVGAVVPPPGTSPILKQLLLRRGHYLDHYLDTILSPFGFTWGIGLGEQKDSKPRIEFFPLGRSRRPAKDIPAQRRGETLKIEESPAEEIALQADVSGSRLVNSVHVFGGHLIYESTFELSPAWDQATHDAFKNSQPSTISRSSAAYLQSQPTSGIRKFMREWVLNEGGDLVGMELPDGTKPSKAYDLNQHLDLTTAAFAERRRQFWPTIALGFDGRPAGPHIGGTRIEYATQGEDWAELPEDMSLFGERVLLLPGECGIRFDGELVPLALMAAMTDNGLGGDGLRIRITASVMADLQLVGWAIPEASPNPERVNANLYLPGSFEYRKIHEGSGYYRLIRDSGYYRSGERDDTSAAMQYAAQLVQSWNQADCAASIVLDGLDWAALLDFRLGDTIRSISGRNINLQTTASYPARYPQIVGIAYSTEGQALTLTLDSFVDDVLTPTRDMGLRNVVPGLGTQKFP
ncbi:MAG: hypothetical protein L0211_23545, partial [Planctomycetaceae bacterium]|nr:hypothetical protein [Planctomycetaceae bacterium]